MSDHERARTEIASLHNQITLRDLAQHNPVVFVGGTASLALGIAVLGYTLLVFLTPAIASSSLLLYLAVGVVLIGLSMVLLTMLVFGPAGVLVKKHAKRLENIELAGLSENELHALIDLQREKGNLAEADRISQHLLKLVDQDQKEPDR